MAARRSKLSFLDTHSVQLADHISAIGSEKRLEVLRRCFTQFPQHILDDPNVVDGIRALEDPMYRTDNTTQNINDRANEMIALSIEADEIGNDEEAKRLDQIGSILSAVSFAIENRPLSAVYADKALYYMSQVLTEDFVRDLISSTQ